MITPETTHKKPIRRCQWAQGNELMERYHDEQWGVPLYDDNKLFEFLVLDMFQAGLSWQTILNKRAHFRVAFEDFKIKKVAQFDETDFERLMQDAGIVRNRLKIRAAIAAAQNVLEIQKEFGSFSTYLWHFVNDVPLVRSSLRTSDIPTTSPEAEAVSRDLKKRGFTFVGPTIMYAFMQAAGMVNDHTVECFRYKKTDRKVR